MVHRLDTAAGDFEHRFSAFLGAKREVSEDVNAVVAEIISDIRARGDQALVDLTQRFDRFDTTPEALRFSDAEIERAAGDCEPQTISALELARDRIWAYHERQRPRDDWFTDSAGVELGHRWTAVDAVGLYVPGGTAAYPSSVLMNAVPARVAGVERIAMVVPTPDGTVNPLVLAAARIAGVSEIYRIGGAQAIAALAYGTKTVKPVSKIVGPGNAYVAAAKRQVFGTVGIDMIAGPSEVLVVADSDNDPAWIAADLLAQAEHDVSAQSILLTDDAGFAEAVEREVSRQLQRLPRAEMAGASWAEFGALILVRSLGEAPALVNRIAPEHLELAVADPDALIGDIHNAGAIFLGACTPEAIGDYVAGSNHVLPTARSARFSSGLGVLDFMKRTSLLRCSAASLEAIGPAAIALGRAEGLEAHARSVEMRLDRVVE